MGLDGVTAPISPVQSAPIAQPQAAPEPPDSEPEATGEEEGGGKADGVLRKLESGHFKGRGVSDIRLRIAHFDNPELEPIPPEELSPVPEDAPGKAYQKFLDQYTALYEGLVGPADVVINEAIKGNDDPETHEVQTVLIKNAPGGIFTLTYDGQTTTPISYDASESDLENALEGLSSIINVDVAQTILPDGNTEFAVTFMDSYADVALMTSDASGLVKPPDVLVSVDTEGDGSNNEIQDAQASEQEAETLDVVM